MKFFHDRSMSPNGEIVLSLLCWTATALSIRVCFGDVAGRYDTVVKVQEARMACQARGGFYGSQGKAKAKARCLER